MTQQELKEYIIARVFPNKAQEITGASLQDALLAIVDNSQNEEEATEALARLATDISEIEDTVAQNTADIATKQETLTLTVKDNGNIVIGNLDGQTKEFMPATPSGDPMHYAYEAVGAVWNASTGYWELSTLTDLTNEQMRMIFARGSWGGQDDAPFSAISGDAFADIRVNLARTGRYNLTMGSHCALQFADYNNTIEVFNMTPLKNATVQSSSSVTWPANSNYAFRGCAKLKRILGFMNFANVTSVVSTFEGCEKLEYINLNSLKTSISFADSPLSVESATSLLQNANSTEQFTVIFRADRQAIYEANAEFMTALNEKPNITILYQ